MAYLDVFEHTSDPLIQKRVMQIMMDIMAWRPQFELSRTWYFPTTYTAEITYLEGLLKILKEIVNF